ncbi:hypothetical protein ACQJBY_038735 [Aegilops geniculata]
MCLQTKTLLRLFCGSGETPVIKRQRPTAWETCTREPPRSPTTSSTLSGFHYMQQQKIRQQYTRQMVLFAFAAISSYLPGLSAQHSRRWHPRRVRSQKQRSCRTRSWEIQISLLAR